MEKKFTFILESEDVETIKKHAKKLERSMAFYVRRMFSREAKKFKK